MTEQEIYNKKIESFRFASRKLYGMELKRQDLIRENKPDEANQLWNRIRKCRQTLAKVYQEDILVLETNKDIEREDLKVKFFSSVPADALFATTFGRNQFFDQEMEQPMKIKMAQLCSAIADVPVERSITILNKANSDRKVQKTFLQALDRENKRDKIFVDLETTSIDPELGSIIEIGIIITDYKDNVIESYEERFDFSDDRELKHKIGVGNQDIHGIAPDDLENKRLFTDKEVQEKLQELICRENSILIAHNDDFEVRWLETYLDNFAECYQVNRLQKEPKNYRFDVRALSMAFHHEVNNSKLEGFAEKNGVPYVNAHSAYADSEMTRKALNNFIKRFRENKGRIE